jgi:hypothetical protein
VGINIEFKNSINGHTIQEKIWKSDKRFIDLLAGRRGGKNWIADRLAIKRIYQDLANGNGNKYHSFDRRLPSLHYWYVAPTYPMTKIFQKEIFTFLAENNAMALVQKDLTLSKNQLWLYPDILIEFKSADNPERLVGTGLNGIRITETARLKPTVWNDNLRPTLADKQGWAILDTTPLGYNWYAKEIREPALKDLEWDCFHWNTVDNTKVVGLADEVAKARESMPNKYFTRNYEASLDAFFGQVYEEFDREIHVADFDYEPNQYEVVTAGVDWGYAHNGSITVCGFRLDGGVDVLACESHSRLLVDPEWSNIAKELQAKYNIDAFYCGVDQPESIQIFKNNDIYAMQADNSVANGIFLVSSLLHIDSKNQALLRINSSCDNLIKGMTTYRYKPQKDGIDSDVVEKMNDDEVDSLRYCIASSKFYLKHLTDRVLI